jgi:hypothetical protein
MLSADATGMIHASKQFRRERVRLSKISSPSSRA